MFWLEEGAGIMDRAVIETPVGHLALYSQGEILLKSAWVETECTLCEPDTEFLAQVINQVSAYWRQGLCKFDMTLLKQGSAFQSRVWQALLDIPYAETVSYSTLAANIDSGARAVGGACRNNPFVLIVPCHRVVAVNGPGGYAGKTAGRMSEIKQALLEHESLAH